MAAGMILLGAAVALPLAVKLIMVVENRFPRPPVEKHEQPVPEPKTPALMR
jgi:hypothetical protein